MAGSDMDRIKSKLFALNLRLAEVNSEVAAAHTRVVRLEKQLEDARLAALLGEEAGSPSEIGPELEIHRSKLADGQRLQERIQHSQWETRIRYMIARRLQMQAAQEAGKRRENGEESEGS
jgi:hypothetical protein